MEGLRGVPNIGKILEEKLIEVGIDSSQELKRVGSREAFRRMNLQGRDCCINKLYALEGAVQGVRWHYLSEEVKKSLQEFLATIKNKHS